LILPAFSEIHVKNTSSYTFIKSAFHIGENGKAKHKSLVSQRFPVQIPPLTTLLEPIRFSL